MPWLVDGWGVSLMSDSGDIIGRDEGREREWRRTRASKLGLETRLRWEWDCSVLVRRRRGMEAGRP